MTRLTKKSRKPLAYAIAIALLGGAAVSNAQDVDLATFTNGFRIDGIDAFDESGFSVSGAGDVNGLSLIHI